MRGRAVETTVASAAARKTASSNARNVASRSVIGEGALKRADAIANPRRGRDGLAPAWM